MGIQTDYEKDYMKNGVFNQYRENGEWDQTQIWAEKRRLKEEKEQRGTTNK